MAEGRSWCSVGSSVFLQQSLTVGKAMVIKLAVSRISGSFFSMRAGGIYFYFWSAFARKWVQSCTRRSQIYTGTYGALKGLLAGKSLPPCTFLCRSPQWVVSRRQPHRCKSRAASTSGLLNELQTHSATRFVCSRHDSHEQWYTRKLHITVTIFWAWFWFNQLYIL